jgi:hypothetical protein
MHERRLKAKIAKALAGILLHLDIEIIESSDRNARCRASSNTSPRARAPGFHFCDIAVGAEPTLHLECDHPARV